jgi:hypothetical protein
VAYAGNGWADWFIIFTATVDMRAKIREKGKREAVSRKQ